ncbi:MAG: GWxTD domain-containing protein, partial [Gemmatimonadota bacterium]
AQSAAAQVSDFDVALYRTKRGADLTVVDGVVQFDPHIAAGGEECAYLMGIEVRDSLDTPILQDDWRGVMSCDSAGVSGESQREQRVVETFQFAVTAGIYSVVVSVEPAGRPEAKTQGEYDLVSLSPGTLVSDLILGRDVGIVDTAEIAGWTVRKGQVGVAADPYIVCDASRPTLAYYVELYGESLDTLNGVVEGIIRKADGGEVVRSRFADLEGEPGSRPVAGSLSVAGLPPGEYALEVQIQLGDTVVTRSRGFHMAASFELATAGVDAASDELARYFSDLSDEELAELFDAVEIWLATAQERKTYKGLPPDGKRRFLAYYFEKVAPQFVTGGEPALDMYLERIEYVREAYGERAGREQQAGWRTDRGRIYMLRGRPTERRERPFPSEPPPYEIWSYNVGPGYVYLFVDQTRFGNYRLIYSTDPREPTPPNWESLANRAAIEEMNRYFGIRTQYR